MKFIAFPMAMCLAVLTPCVTPELKCHADEPATTTAPIEPREALQRVRQSLANIASIQYQFRQVYERMDREGKTKTTTTTGEFAWAEGKFYSKFQFETDPVDHIGFDGQLYQRMRDGAPTLNVDTEIPRLPYVTLQPILEQFGFVPYVGKRLEIETIQSEAAWESILEKSTMAEARKIDDHECVVLKFSTVSRLGVEIFWEVSAAKDLDYYPIQVANRSREGDQRVESASSVKKFADLKTKRGRVIVPLEIETVSRNAKGDKIMSTITKVDEKSVKANEPIGNETFWLKRLKPIKVRFLGNVTDEQEKQFEKGPRGF